MSINKNAPQLQSAQDAKASLGPKDTTLAPKYQIKNDALIDVAMANSSRDLSWKNTQILFSEFLNRVSVTHRTHEAYSEYLASKKERQDEIKNIGGYVGGFLVNGSRKKGNVLHRQLITLDADFATDDFWENYTTFFGNAACIYSTHKHSPDNPRLRLIIPLSREVFADEYMAISRRIAGALDIELFDPTTFQPERMMYWPSTSKDAEFLFEYQDGAWLDADAVLASYTDWKDSSEWPISEKVDKVILRDVKKQGDPLEKPGLIGAFCQSYTITEAIEKYLYDVYDESAVPGRYTYREGSTGAGLVLYEDKYAYSHHGSDPTSGKLCNAFDLVRIHKFGLHDSAEKAGTAINKMPSYLAMQKLASEDPKVKTTLLSERMLQTKSDFEFEIAVDSNESENMEWTTELKIDSKGNLKSLINNVVLVLENDTAFKDNFAYDEFLKQTILKRDLPWRRVNEQSKYFTNNDLPNTELYIETRYNLSARQLSTALQIIDTRTSFHPVKDYLKSLDWDGIKRVDTLFIDYMGCSDNPYTRAATRKTLCAACARVFQPGIKFDYMLTFVGSQGRGKSSLIGKLGRQWFSDSFTTVQGKESIEQIQGVWLVEVAELAGLKKADVEAVKHYISKREDRYRPAYGQRVENFPRQCIFFGSTNKIDFLKDPSGNRRFWPIVVSESLKSKDVFKDLTSNEVDQVWAEAYQFFKKGETLYLTPEIEEIAFKVQEQHSEKDDREGIILDYLDTLLPNDWDAMDIWRRREFLKDDEMRIAGTVQRNKVCAAEIYCELLDGQKKDMCSSNTRFIHDIMRKLPGWHEFKSKTSFGQYGTLKGYFRKADISVERKEPLICKS